MIESTLWKHLRPGLNRIGKFQKVSDRFTSGVPDIIGCYKGQGIAIELKELDGVRKLKTKFRPGQVDWLTEWADNGGTSLIICSHKSTVGVHSYLSAERMESGMSTEEFKADALLLFTKSRKNRWIDLVIELTYILK
jgi:penicillin-binding protein-related factor A (putative recombinase)